MISCFNSTLKYIKNKSERKAYYINLACSELTQEIITINTKDLSQTLVACNTLFFLDDSVRCTYFAPIHVPELCDEHIKQTNINFQGVGLGQAKHTTLTRKSMKESHHLPFFQAAPTYYTLQS
jgi:hypothetical protein